MRIVDQEPMETIHLYVVPEEQLPPKRETASAVKAILCLLLLLVFLCLALTTPSADHEVAFPLAIQGYALTPVTKTLTIPVRATGKQQIAATTAAGTITLYNGAIYTQIIPVGTILTGTDGIAVVTDEQAVIPPAAQTIPPTYGQVSVSAHALLSGKAGNIQAGDINMACCVTSVIAQNPYNFQGGKNAYTYRYLTSQDMKNATHALVPQVQQQALLLFGTSLVLDPTCHTNVLSNKAVGQPTTSADVTITSTCQAFSYKRQSVTTAIAAYQKHFGTGTLSHVQFQVVGGAKGGSIHLYVTATFTPMVVHQFVVK